MGPIDIHWPTAMEPDENVVNVALYQDDALIATVSPPPHADANWHWALEPGRYEADIFRPVGTNTIVIEVSIDPRIGEAADRVCLWNGDDLLDCTELGVRP